MFKHLKCSLKTACLCFLLSSEGVGQTITPPIAEYRGKAQGLYELHNDGDVPLVAIVEIQSFKVSEDGNLTYQAADSATKVDIGSSSFVLAPHQSHMVFYKATPGGPNAWFTVLSTLTRAATDRSRMRINFVLPHVVYLYQKQKLKKDDVSVSVSPGENGELTLQVMNRSDKLARIDSVTWRGFQKNADSGGFPLFPRATRRVKQEVGTALKNAAVKVNFEDGFSVVVPVQ